eukprot:scpid60193/ scgid22711/ 
MIVRSFTPCQDEEEPEPSPPTLDEYGEPSPMRVAFCSRMTEEEYDQQASETTKRALDDLYSSMDTNPVLYKRILQRRKREEMENGGMFSYLKAQALAFVGREDAFAVSEDECASKMNSMKSQMSKVFQYSEGLREHNGVKRSTRLMEKKLRKSKRQAASNADIENSNPLAAVPPARQPISTFAAVSSASPSFGNSSNSSNSITCTLTSSQRAAVPPPPPLPTSYARHQLKPRPKIQYKRKGDVVRDHGTSPARKSVNKENRKSPKALSVLKINGTPSPKWSSPLAVKSVSPGRQSSRLQVAESTSPSLMSKSPSPSAGAQTRALRSATANSSANETGRPPLSGLLIADIVNRKKHLKRATKARSPGGTPKLHAVTRPASNTPASLFNAELVKKFRNAHLQSPSPTHSCNTSFNDSMDSSGWTSPDMARKQVNQCS